MSAFALDPRLGVDSHVLAEGPLSQLRLIDDLRFPWLVLVPRVAGASELLDLAPDDQQSLLAEINQASRLLLAWAPCDKLNIGALGNIVRQLHVHVLARREGDAAWPGPAWGSGEMLRAAPEERERRRAQLRGLLDTDFWRPG